LKETEFNFSAKLSAYLCQNKIKRTMMNRWTKVVVAVAAIFVTGTVAANDELIAFSQLPEKAQAFVKAHFSEKDVAASLLDKENVFRKEYTVVLHNGTKIEFDGKGEWEKVKVKSGAVPSEIIPSFILRHIQKNFPDTHVKELERSRNRYEVEISNGLELEFDKKGNLLKVGD